MEIRAKIRQLNVPYRRQMKREQAELQKQRLDWFGRPTLAAVAESYLFLDLQCACGARASYRQYRCGCCITSERL
ncbi:hypothetical protein V5799_025636 [Amblyomma americanum]|uniref:Uncharacterized protein n=1 Tax=Amblyomma americanum TaxID=6943 RepID=A0AAQ4E8Y5_AMBAM